MREKYIDEAVGTYFIFGENGDMVDVTDGSRDVFTCIDRFKAYKICVAQAEFREKLYKIMNA